MNTHESHVDHEQASLLLPWLVNGTLSETERLAVERHAAECADCAAEVESLKIMQAAIRNDALAPIVPKADADTVLSKIDSPTSSDRGRRVVVSLGYAIAASVIIAVAIAALLRINSEPPQAVIFETATSANDAATMSYVFDLGFSPNATDSDRRRVFAALNTVDVSPTGGNHYKVTIPLTVSSVQDLQAYADELQAMPEVKSAKVIALQLPIRNEE